MLFNDNKSNEKQGSPYPGNGGNPSGVSSFRAYSPGKNVEVTVKRDANGNVQAVFARDLFLGVF